MPEPIHEPVLGVVTAAVLLFVSGFFFGLVFDGAHNWLALALPLGVIAAFGLAQDTGRLRG